VSTKDKISAYQVGQVVGAVSARYESKTTLPPDRYDMATILDMMLSAWRLADNEGDREVLRLVEGLGTARTRQAIVDGLVRKGLLTVAKIKKRHVLTPTSIAEELRDRVPPMLGSVAMTAKWEYAFSLIEQGKIEWRAVVDKAHLFAGQIVEAAKQQTGKFSAQGSQSSAGRAPPVNAVMGMGTGAFGRKPAGGK
jgi:DNA topoisomerase-3